jgi:hypothetical protein
LLIDTMMREQRRLAPNSAKMPENFGMKYVSSTMMTRSRP